MKRHRHHLRKKKPGQLPTPLPKKKEKTKQKKPKNKTAKKNLKPKNKLKKKMMHIPYVGISVKSASKISIAVQYITIFMSV